jgi:hypothetical protein
MKISFGARKLIRLLRDYSALARSGLFMHSAYNRYYFKGLFLKSGYLFWLSLPHYLLRGEQRGYRPNPFFDPNFFEQQAKTRRLADYLGDPALWKFPTSDYFDADWYAKTHSGPPSATENPLTHFWRSGFDTGLSPSPRLDITFFKAAIARSETWDKKRYAFDHFCNANPQAPLNAAELEAHQDRFRASIKLQTLKFAAATDKKFLVFVQAGRDFIPRFASPAAPFDILLNFYDAAGETDAAQYAFQQRGTKTTAIHKLRDTYPELFERYAATLFLDDDVEISASDICALFRAQEQYQLDLLQASLSADSSCYFPPLKQPLVGAGLHYLSGVEIMMPVISRRALRDCGWVFGESISGWGADILLSAEVRRRYGNSIGILGDAIAVHKRPTRTDINPLYKLLAAHNISATAEAGRIALKYRLDDRQTWISPCNDAQVPLAQLGGAALSAQNASGVF